eukprot:scaffold54583_cov64-Cyclotella_meneghiniana.AAC.1
MPPFQDPFSDDGFVTLADEFISSIERDFGFKDNHVVEVDIDAYVNRVLGSFADDGHAPSGAYDEVFDDELFDCGSFTDVEDDCSLEPHVRMPNEFGYSFGNVYESSWFKKFLAPDVREKTYRSSSRDRYGAFCSHFRMPLVMVDTLTHLFLGKGWVGYTKRINSYDTLFLRTQLHILGTLEVLGSHTPFRKLETSTNISTEEHRKFFHLFLDRMYSVRDDYIKYPETLEDLRPIMKQYAEQFLPGCGGSIDVVHLKWSNCPAGDRNRCTGKEKFPTLAFECISDNKRRILGVSSIQYGTRNDQHIVKLDETVSKLKTEWYKDVMEDRGVYLICDGGYLRWPVLICPYKHESCATQKGYFSSKLESVRKDVECCFGILKKRWKILEYGLRFRDIKVCEKVFIVCSMLHNMMIDDSETRESTVRVGRGAPAGTDGIWLRNNEDEPPAARTYSDTVAQVKWMKRRNDLAAHVEYMARCAKRRRTSSRAPV